MGSSLIAVYGTIFLNSGVTWNPLLTEYLSDAVYLSVFWTYSSICDKAFAKIYNGIVNSCK